ncbi:hypothetical protein [Zoogloea sp.]|uniref:hypothetical protein n=1 Tax=Zoogloea sp. TaxID=49181 RepID=UPI001ACEF9F2|nr:hypothetical protein [Zoogloea sp.]MBN8282822.1 hypothetical protein [Zoogloea sp.]
MLDTYEADRSTIIEHGIEFVPQTAVLLALQHLPRHHIPRAELVLRTVSSRTAVVFVPAFTNRAQAGSS